MGRESWGNGLGSRGGFPESRAQDAVVHDQEVVRTTGSRSSGCLTFAVAVQTAGFGDLHNLAFVGQLDRTRLRAVHVE
jgi:hypothetical protein